MPGANIFFMKMRLIVRGNVQGVGYRALVKQTARDLQIKGQTKNLEDGTVEIFAESDETVLKKFKKLIDIRSGKQLFSINVEEICVYLEGDKNYVNPPVQFGVFNIDYCEEAKSAFEKANLERLEIGTLVMSSFKDQTAQNFGMLDEKYGLIAKELINTRKEMKTDREILMASTGKEMKEDREILKKEMKEDRKILIQELSEFKEMNRSLAEALQRQIK